MAIMQEAAENITCYQVPGWQGPAAPRHGFFAGSGGCSAPPYGSLNLGPFSGDSEENIAENLRRAAGRLPVPAASIFCPAQVHGADILTLAAPPAAGSIFTSRAPLKADAAITADKNLCLGILTADCLPVLLWDPGHPAIGAAHAGWRGTLENIAGKTAEKMQQAFGSRPEALRAALGPAIGPCCYIVGEEVVRAFEDRDRAYRDFIRPAGDARWRLDLSGLNRRQLIMSGIKASHIYSAGVCTSCRKDLFFSVRARGEPTGRQISLIALG